MGTKRLGEVFEVVGTGKNEGKRARARVTESHIYTLTLEIFEPIGDCKLRKADRQTKEFWLSSGKTSAALKGQTSWQVADEDLSRFMKGA